MPVLAGQVVGLRPAPVLAGKVLGLDPDDGLSAGLPPGVMPGRSRLPANASREPLIGGRLPPSKLGLLGRLMEGSDPYDGLDPDGREVG